MTKGGEPDLLSSKVESTLWGGNYLDQHVSDSIWGNQLTIRLEGVLPRGVNSWGGISSLLLVIVGEEFFSSSVRQL
jgi:hypothetical protein